MSPLFFAADNYWLEIGASDIPNKKTNGLVPKSGKFNLEMVLVLFEEGRKEDKMFLIGLAVRGRGDPENPEKRKPFTFRGIKEHFQIHSKL